MISARQWPNLVAHYESEGDMAVHLLRQERRVPAYAEGTEQGKRFHADWCARVFAPWLNGLGAVDRRRRFAQVVADLRRLQLVPAAPATGPVAAPG